MATDQKPLQQSRRTAIGASLIGSALEWYDFALYSAATALVFSKVFFPDSEPVVATLQSFATFAAGFIVRPFGGMFFGSLGDRVGRKRVLVITLLMMGGATTLIGLLPTHDQVGMLAPVLLLLLRLVQGLGAGAEFGGATLTSAEYSDPRRRGLYAAFPAAGTWIGTVLASASIAPLGLLPEREFLAWGWRIPFLASVVIVAFGMYVRVRMAETPAFADAASSRKTSSRPLRDALVYERRSVLTLIFAQLGVAATSYFYQVFSLSYAVDELELRKSVAAAGLLVAALVSIPTTLLFGALSDRVGRKPVLLFGYGFVALFAYPFFWIAQIGGGWPFHLAMTVAIGVGISAIFGAQGAFFAELFSTRVRYSGFAVGRETANALGGGFSPMIGVALLAAGAGSPILVVAYVAGMCVLSGATVALAPETRNADLAGAHEDTSAAMPRLDPHGQAVGDAG